MKRLILIAVACCCACSVKAVRFEGESMMPSIKDGDRLLVEDLATEPKRGEIVMFLSPQDQSRLHIKRVVGLPGESIGFTAGKVRINGEFLQESYIDPENSRSVSDVGPVTVEKGRYFVLGDNRDNSTDSRAWGSIDRDLIVGRVRLTY